MKLSPPSGRSGRWAQESLWWDRGRTHRGFRRSLRGHGRWRLGLLKEGHREVPCISGDPQAYGEL